MYSKELWIAADWTSESVAVESYDGLWNMSFLATDPEVPGSIPGTTRFS
jgi:hypothetical protein